MRVVESADELAPALAVLTAGRADEPLFFDTETTGLSPQRNCLVMVQLKHGHGEAVIIDTRPRGVPEEALIPFLRQLFEQTTGDVVGHNLKFDLGFLYHIGVEVPACRLFCTQLTEQLIQGVGQSESQYIGGVSLAATYKRYGGDKMSKEERSWFIDVDMRHDDWVASFPQVQLDYAALDVDALELIYHQQKPKIDEPLAFTNGKTLRKVWRLEHQIMPAIVRIEAKGILIDVPKWEAFIAEKAQEADALEAEALEFFGEAIVAERIEEFDRQWTEWAAAREALEKYEAELRDYVSKDGVEALGGSWGAFKAQEMRKYRAEHPIPARPHLDLAPPNLDSSAQMLAAFNRLGIRLESTRAEFLQEIQDEHEAVEKFLAYRAARKFVTSFGPTLLSKVDPHAGRIHPTINQIGAGTGRTSCSDPNWQQIPRKGDGKKLRALVHPAGGSKFVIADLSNIEARVLADITGNQALLDIFKSGQDLHAEVAKMMFNLPAEWTKAQVEASPSKVWLGKSDRDVAKTINYGLFFGMSEKKLGKTLGQDIGVAKTLMRRYFEVLPGLRNDLQKLKDVAVRNHCAYTQLGRYRKLAIVPNEPHAPDRKQLPPAPNFPAHTPKGKAELAEARKQWMLKAAPIKAANAEIDALHRGHMKAWFRLRARVERQGMNTPVQGTAADIAKRAILHFDYWEQHQPVGAQIVAFVHDEIVVECPAEMAEVAATRLGEAMDKACHEQLRVVTLEKVTPKITDHWEH